MDITAAARSVLRVSTSESDPEIRVLSHIKSSVSKPGAPIAYRIEDNGSILYLGEYDGDVESDDIYEDSSKRSKVAEIIHAMLCESPREGTEVYKACKEAGIGSRTVERVKKELNVRSERDGSKRLWVLP